ncbi:MAG: general secretion pathway protein GspB [Nitrospirae bacterium]|nr:general secretion pathway protein GspB [Nitrospirota bacterium]
MSFILDQLKKSGKKRALEMNMRRQSEKPAPTTAEPLLVRSDAPAPVSMQKWQLAFVAVLLGAVVFYGAVVFFRGSPATKRPEIPTAAGLARETSLPPTAPLSAPLVLPPQSSLQDAGAPEPKSSAAELKPIEAAKAVREVAIPDKGRNDRDHAGADISTVEKEKKPRAAVTDAPIRDEPSDSVLEFKQLPLSVRKNLPDIRVTSHLYKKESRLVSINGRIMTEGFNMDDGLFLEEITPQGVILSYGRYRFLVRAER